MMHWICTPTYSHVAVIVRCVLLLCCYSVYITVDTFAGVSHNTRREVTGHAVYVL